MVEGLNTKHYGPGSHNQVLLWPHLVWREKSRCEERVDDGHHGGGSRNRCPQSFPLSSGPQEIPQEIPLTLGKRKGP